MAHFYAHCAHLLQLTLSQQSSLKSIVASHCPASSYSIADQKRYLATVISILAWREALEEAVKATKLDTDSKQIGRVLGPVWRRYQQEKPGSSKSTSEGGEEKSKRAKRDAESLHLLLLALVHDLLVSRSKRISATPTWPPAKWLTSFRPRLQAELVKLQVRKGKSSIEELRLDNQARSGQNGGAEPDQWQRGRWVRINTRKTSMEEFETWLSSTRWSRIEADYLSVSESSKGSSASNRRYMLPPVGLHPPNLLLFPMGATAELLASDPYQKGHLILQDAASCWPAWLLLSPLLNQAEAISSAGSGKKKLKPKLHILDATAAPGNKTSHLSALVYELTTSQRNSYSSIKLLALERDQQRFKTLRQQLKRAGALSEGQSTSSDLPGAVTALRADFLTIEPFSDDRFTDVTHMLLDPSCSGSGITGRLDWLTQATKESTATAASEADEVDDSQEQDGGGNGVSSEEDRLQRLSDVQLKMIEHAFGFPNLQRLVYSTCSIHVIEDESVVHRALSSPHARAIVDGRPYKWVLAPRQECLPAWPWRGVDSDSSSSLSLEQGMMRAWPDRLIAPEEVYLSASQGSERPIENQRGFHPLKTNGFFAATFVRIPLEVSGGNTVPNGKRKAEDGDGDEEELPSTNSATAAAAAAAASDPISATTAVSALSSAAERRSQKAREKKRAYRANKKARLREVENGDVGAAEAVHVSLQGGDGDGGGGDESEEEEWGGCSD